MKVAEIKVKYVDHSGSDLKVVNCARASFDKTSKLDEHGYLKGEDANLINFLARGCTTQEWEGLAEKMLAAEDKCFVQELLRQHKASAVHFAPFCHASVTLRLEIPVFVARQLVKHQVGMTWSEVSRRYVSDEPEFWFPSTWSSRPKNVKQGSGKPVHNQRLVTWLAKDCVSDALAAYKTLLCEGVAPEEARIILPLNHMTTIVWTGTLLAWTRVANQRLDTHAQTATREVAKGIQDVVKPLFPVSWNALVAYD